MPGVATMTEFSAVTIEIGGLPIRMRSEDPAFIELLKQRYAGFLPSHRAAKFDFEVELVQPSGSPGEDVSVHWDAGQWSFRRGDFRAEWNPSSARGRIRQTANPYSLDSVLRIVHTLLLARQGGFLVHASSAVRNGRAFLFAGVSGAGKTTIAKLAPPNALLLTDEISYVSRQENGYEAFGTPFVGELGRSGMNLRAPIAALYLLAKGAKNAIEDVNETEAVRGVLENVLFFSKDSSLVERVFQSACDFVSAVPVRRLKFVPDARVWELIV